MRAHARIAHLATALVLLTTGCGAGDVGGGTTRPTDVSSTSPGATTTEDPSPDEAAPGELPCAELTPADLHLLRTGLRVRKGEQATILAGVTVPTPEPGAMDLSHVLALRLILPDGSRDDAMLASSTSHPAAIPGITYALPSDLTWLTWGIYVPNDSRAAAARNAALSTSAATRARECLDRAATRAAKAAAEAEKRKRKDAREKRRAKRAELSGSSEGQSGLG